jgi:NTE family protein
MGCPLPSYAQVPPPPYRNLIMKGGGIRGIAYGGALQELERQGVLAHIMRVGGTSAGAIQAALLAVGYAPEAIIDIINRTPVQRLNDGRFIFVGGGSRLLRQYGWYRGDQLTKYLCELVGHQTQRPNLTLGELHQLAWRSPATTATSTPPAPISRCSAPRCSATKPTLPCAWLMPCASA